MRSSTALKAAAALLLMLMSPAAAAYDPNKSHGERSEEDTQRVFGEWKAMYGKTYGSVSEEERRYAAFKDNLRFVDRHNAAADARIYTYRLALYDFSDLTSEERRARTHGCRGKKGTRSFC